jgi:hypothetical protein
MYIFVYVPAAGRIASATARNRAGLLPMQSPSRRGRARACGDRLQRRGASLPCKPEDKAILPPALPACLRASATPSYQPSWMPSAVPSWDPSASPTSAPSVSPSQRDALLPAILDAKCSTELGSVRVSDQRSQRVPEPARRLATSHLGCQVQCRAGIRSRLRPVLPACLRARS